MTVISSQQNSFSLEYFGPLPEEQVTSRSFPTHGVSPQAEGEVPSQGQAADLGIWTGSLLAAVQTTRSGSVAVGLQQALQAHGQLSVAGLLRRWFRTHQWVT